MPANPTSDYQYTGRGAGAYTQARLSVYRWVLAALIRAIDSNQGKPVTAVQVLAAYRLNERDKLNLPPASRDLVNKALATLSRWNYCRRLWRPANAFGRTVYEYMPSGYTRWAVRNGVETPDMYL